MSHALSLYINKGVYRFQTLFLAPIKAIKRRYIPLLLVYFAYGLSGVSSVAMSFWQKEELGLSAQELISVSLWMSIPWVLKMIFGQMVDCVPLFKSSRKIYIYIGALLMVIGMSLLALLAGKYTWIQSLGSPYQIYLLSSFFTTFGFVLQDTVADTMSTEVVDRIEEKNGKQVPRNEKDIQTELTLIQVLGRLSLIGATFIVGYLGGFIASIWSYETIFWIMLSIPLISCISTPFIKLNIQTHEREPLNWKIIIGGLLFACISVIISLKDIPYSQEILFISSGIILVYLLHILLKDTPQKTKSIILKTLGTIFIYRLFALSGSGPGVQWWSIDVLGFDERFFGVLRQISATMTILMLWFGTDFIAKKSIRTIFLFLVWMGLFLSLPEIIVYYNIHEISNLSPRTIFLFDTALESPLTQISMVPMLAMIAFYAPAQKRGTWFAVSASLMNLALTGGYLFTKYLNDIFVVTREIRGEDGTIITEQDYSQLGFIFLSKTIIAFLVPFFVILFVLQKQKTPQKAKELLQSTQEDISDEAPIPSQKDTIH